MYTRYVTTIIYKIIGAVYNTLEIKLGSTFTTIIESQGDDGCVDVDEVEASASRRPRGVSSPAESLC